jgi:hypothetical protein
MEPNIEPSKLIILSELGSFYVIGVTDLFSYTEFLSIKFYLIFYGVTDLFYVKFGDIN